jgi:GT2 family glycosyltransferase
MKLTVIVPFFNGYETIGRLLESLPKELPVILVDDHSDVPFEWTGAGKPDLTIIRPYEKGYFSGAVNVGLVNSQTDVLILNQDSYLLGDEWLNLIAEKRGEYGLIGERIRGQHPYWPHGYIHGTFMFIRRDVISKVGLLNQVDYPLWGSTCEYQLRACRKGFRALPLAQIPGFTHQRRGKFGSSIETILEREPDKKALFTDVPPKISVVTACYNHGRYLPDLVASLRWVNVIRPDARADVSII